MEYIEFGSEKRKVSKVILGLMRIPELASGGIDRLLNTAFDNGINFLDIADCYANGYAEELLGNELVASVFVPFQINLVVILDFSLPDISLGSAVIFKTA